MTHSGRFTHINGHPSATGWSQDRESTPAEDRRSTTEPLNRVDCQCLWTYTFQSIQWPMFGCGSGHKNRPSHRREPCTLPLSPPKGGTNGDFAVLPVKSNFCWKKSATKFLCVKTSSGKVVAASFLCLMVHRWIAGNVPVYKKCALTPLRKMLISTDFA